MDRRTAKGLRKIQIWITRDLSDRLDVARDGRPMQKFVPRLLDEGLAIHGRTRRIAHELPPDADSFSVEVRADGTVDVVISSSRSGEQTEHLYKL